MSKNQSSKKPIWRSKYILWFFLMLPGLLFTIGFADGKMTYNSLMHSTGEFSARFLIFTLIASPLVLMFQGKKFPKWLLRNRRYFGVAAFAYGLHHTITYLMEVPTDQVWKEFFQFGMLTGWIAMIIWIPLAITSTDGMVRKLKSNWQQLHNFTYLAALMVVLHWSFLHYNWKPALVHFVPVLLLQVYRFIKVRKK